MKEYKTVSGVSSASIFEKKSEFISSAAFVETEEDALKFLNKIRANNKGAAHNVYAYILKNNAIERCSDDGEPAKTSGPPTLEVIRHEEIVNCIVVTTRYFGGTLLGTGGLVRAYTQAAKAALSCAKIVTVSVCLNANLTVPYALYEQAVRIITLSGAKVGECVFSENVNIPFVMLPIHKDNLLQELQTLCKGEPIISISKPYNAPF